MFPIFKYEMAPLSDFVVTERKPKPKERIALMNWIYQNHITHNINNTKLTITIKSKAPTDVEIFMHHADGAWTVVWEK